MAHCSLSPDKEDDVIISFSIQNANHCSLWVPVLVDRKLLQSAFPSSIACSVYITSTVAMQLVSVR